MPASHRLALILALVAVPAVASAQTRPETIRGRVTSDSGAAVIGATVSATMAPDRSFLQATTDSSGRFSIHFTAGTGDYLIHVSAVGYKTFRQRLTRAPGDTSLTIDVKLSPAVTQLATVKVQATKPRPSRGGSDNTGAAEQQKEGVFAAITPGNEGNLAAIANSIPGASDRGDGLSVLGLPGTQSNATLNGMAFGGASIPRDANVEVSVTTSTYDPSRGGFSGGQTSISLGAGSPYLSRRAHLTLDAPPLQTPGPFGDQLGQRFTSITGSLGGSGEWVENKWYYNSALQVSRRSADVASLLSVNDAVLTAAGVAPDSAARLVQLLGAQQLPVTGTNVPGSAISQAVSFVTRLDHAPYKPGTFDANTETWNVSVFGNLADDRAQALSPLAVPTRGGSHRALFAGTQLDYSRFFGDVLSGLRTALSTNRDRGTPYLRAPGGNVLVSSVLPTGDEALTGLAFGGNGALDYDRSSWTWETISETKWYAKGRPHRLKLTLDSRLDGYSHSAPEDLLGTFSFPSLAALEAGSPSSFSRTISAPSRTGGEWSGFAALGDYWRVTPSLQVLYGARLEGNHFTTTLADNPAVATAFGASTSHAPNTVHVSPRVGFTWYFGHEPNGGYSVSRIAKMTFMPTMMLRGGIGEFRGLLPPTLLADASVANGLPGGVSRIMCIGDAVPTPLWDDYLTGAAAIPTTCANGAPSSFSDAAPSVRLFDPSYDAPRSWRANVAWGRSWHGLGLMLDGTWSLNLNQPGTVDLNFRGTPQFTLADEGNRPVFVSPSSIVPATGVLSPVDARVDPAFGRVVSGRSDLRSTSRQLTVQLTPQRFPRYFYSLAYTLGDIRADARGFDGATFAAPTTRERAPGDYDVRHQVIASLGTTYLPHGMSVSVFGRFMSGLPYTPRIAGDVNGDGLANDRAFVFNPDRVSDAAVAGGMRALLEAAPSQARDCLRQQLGQPAARNSCRGPWTATMNAQVGLVNRFGFTKRGFNATLHLTNPLGGLDELLHGTNHLQGWGGGAFPDPTLLTVRGFDPTTKRYIYEVNPRFGSTRATQKLARVPFRATLDFMFDLGVPLAKQQAIRLLNPGRNGHPGSRLPVDTIMKKLKQQVPDVYDVVMQESDSLLLSRDQVDSLKAAQVGYRARIDSLWRATATTLTLYADDYDADAAMHVIDDATEQAWLIGRDQVPVLERLLSPLQIRLAPWVVGTLKAAIGRKSVGVRMFMF